MLTSDPLEWEIDQQDRDRKIPFHTFADDPVEVIHIDVEKDSFQEGEPLSEACLTNLLRRLATGHYNHQQAIPLEVNEPQAEEILFRSLGFLSSFYLSDNQIDEDPLLPTAVETDDEPQPRHLKSGFLVGKKENWDNQEEPIFPGELLLRRFADESPEE